ncbi:MAG: PspC domain-containing protein [Methanomicrobiaceae archaeon]|uniref:Pspc domain protein n=1 Tax=hydrocarbon metagenome TaxID=938273 RepID=A0A0W8FGI0_9ZZZZ|nr:PspC domain-containing protein [Methanomicrobiaceae archaeon]MDD5420021.1 PspC domain-containing protein [Methanomicrobiaceae archaeon]
MKKTLYRSKRDRIIAGVCGGLGDYLDVDPNVIRLLWVVITVFSGGFPGVILYIVAWVLIPEEGSTVDVEYTVKEETTGQD